MSQKKQNSQSFEELKVWKCARQLQKKVAKLVKIFPKCDQYSVEEEKVIYGTAQITNNK